MTTVDASELRERSELLALDTLEARELVLLLDEARAFLETFSWCRGISSIRLGLAHPGIFAVCLAQLDNSASPEDSELWVVVGDLPPAYLVTDGAKDSLEALERYVEEMSKWVERVESGRSLEGVIPVNVPPTREAGAALASRLKFLRSHFLTPKRAKRNRKNKS